MSRKRWPNRLLVPSAAVALLAAGGSLPALAGEAPTVEGVFAGGVVPADGDATVQLITGDTVSVTDTGDGRHAVSVTPGEGREDIGFQQLEQDGRLTVLPADAVPLLADGTVDPALFDITGLLEQGLDTASLDGLPVIVASAGEVTSAAVAELTAFHDEAAETRHLASVNATSVLVPGEDLRAFWDALEPPRAGADDAAASSIARPQLYLDGLVTATLDQSTGQIGAPEVWDAGFDGAGVTVAVLDTGMDPDHPDLAGRIAQSEDFSDSGGTHDAHGHGTHVGATAAGGGVADDADRPGVAPGAELLNGKVLGDDGRGSDSSVIAGMEWAVAQGADVINMSLGSSAPSDGTDLMSRALNELAHGSDSLFVVAAGNSGSAGDSSVTSPGAADRALTVGAVDRDDALAAFSSRGPRLGDGAVKPDVTAPGVGIVAARADGTSLGDPEGPHYTAASGTSMAAPHVAGAAALLAQRHPDWDSQALKDALISTSAPVPGTPVPYQGGGRLDAAAAVTGALTATGSVALGPYQRGDAEGSADDLTITYTNSSRADVTLTLSLALETAGGNPLAEEALSTTDDEVTVAAGGTAEVTLRAAPDAATRGDYYGYLTATARDGSAVHTTLSMGVRNPERTLTPTVIGLDGEVRDTWPLIWGPGGQVQPDSSERPRSARVQEGTYVIAQTGHQLGAEGVPEFHLAVLPSVEVEGDTEVTLDLRDTVPVEAETPEPSENRGGLHLQYYRELDGEGFTHSFTHPTGGARLMVTPTEQVTAGEFEFSVRWQLAAPLLSAEVDAGGEVYLDPYYMPASPALPETDMRLVAVDAGEAVDANLGDVAGKIAVVRGQGGGQLRQLAEQADESGATALLLVNEPGMPYVGPWYPREGGFALPVMRVWHEHGTELLERIAQNAERDEEVVVGLTGQPHSPYHYDVMQTATGHLPQERFIHTVSDDNTASVNTVYARTGDQDWATSQRLSWRPQQSYAMSNSTRDFPTGFSRTEYISADDSVWQHFVHYTQPLFYDEPVIAMALRDEARSYEPGTADDERWFGSAVRPAIPRGFGTPSVRTPNSLRLLIPEFVDSSNQHYSRRFANDEVTATLLADGKEVGTADEGWATFEVGTEPADYQLDLVTERSGDHWRFGTRTETSWQFGSTAPTGGGEEALPLLQLDYRLGTDHQNSVDGRLLHHVEVSVRHQDELAAPKGVRLSVAASYNGGKTFVPTVALPTGRGTYSVLVPGSLLPRKDAAVTLRTTASDRDGNRVEQTLYDAYLARR